MTDSSFASFGEVDEDEPFVHDVVLSEENKEFVKQKGDDDEASINLEERTLGAVPP
jgi:hypothetical protein